MNPGNLSKQPGFYTVFSPSSPSSSSSSSLFIYSIAVSFCCGSQVGESDRSDRGDAGAVVLQWRWKTTEADHRGRRQGQAVPAVGTTTTDWACKGAIMVPSTPCASGAHPAQHSTWDIVGRRCGAETRNPANSYTVPHQNKPQQMLQCYRWPPPAMNQRPSRRPPKGAGMG